jgi:hypothetical protein
MKFRFVFWVMIITLLEAARTSETSVDNYFTRQYIPEDKSELVQGVGGKARRKEATRKTEA